MPDIYMIRDAVTPIAKSYGIKRIYLFGSYAKGTANSLGGFTGTEEGSYWNFAGNR